jgi:hypothetical protein
MKPMPPSWAIAIAVRDSVTVSIAALTSGMLSAMRRVSGARRRCARQDVGRRGNEQDVVEREPFAERMAFHRNASGTDKPGRGAGFRLGSALQSACSGLTMRLPIKPQARGTRIRGRSTTCSGWGERDRERDACRSASAAAVDPSAIVVRRRVGSGCVSARARASGSARIVRGDVDDVDDRRALERPGPLRDPRHDASSFSTTIGDDVTIGHGAILHGCTIGTTAC